MRWRLEDSANIPCEEKEDKYWKVSLLYAGKTYEIVIAIDWIYYSHTVKIGKNLL